MLQDIEVKVEKVKSEKVEVNTKLSQATKKETVVKTKLEQTK